MANANASEPNVTWADLAADPYPAYAAMRRDRPVAWMPSLGMWWITRYEDVRAVLLDSERFVVGTDSSLIYDTFGENMLTADGPRHARYRDARMNGAFMPQSLAPLRARIKSRTTALFERILSDGRADVRAAVAARLPVLTMIDVFGLPESAEPLIRSWYDAFEAALSNHANDAATRTRARESVETFHAHVQAEIERVRTQPGPGLLSTLACAPLETRLSDEDIRRNALIIMFGGISTVEAVTLNMLWALLRHPDALARVQADRSLLNAAFDETIRWIAPVQSATRHTVEACEIAGVAIPAGATVNCMIAAANRDERVFSDPDTFNLDRPNARRHLGFATGPHLCLGRHLAREEALCVLNHLFDSTRNLRLHGPPTSLVGHEFRQPPSLWLEWDEDRAASR